MPYYSRHCVLAGPACDISLLLCFGRCAAGPAAGGQRPAGQHARQQASAAARPRPRPAACHAAVAALQCELTQCLSKSQNV